MPISPESLQLLISLLGVLVLPLMAFLWREMQTMRRNDIAHLGEDFQKVHARLERIEQRIDAHLHAHVQKV